MGDKQEPPMGELFFFPVVVFSQEVRNSLPVVFAVFELFPESAGAVVAGGFGEKVMFGFGFDSIEDVA